MTRTRGAGRSAASAKGASAAFDPDSLEDMTREELLSVARELLTGRKGRSRDPPVDPDEVAASVGDAMDYEWEPPQRSMSRDVAHHVDTARRHLDAKRWDDALRGSLGIIRGFAEGYDPGFDQDGEVALELQEGIEVADKALVHVKDEELRGAVFEALLDLWWADIGHGGIGLADEIPDLLTKHPTTAQRHGLADLVKARLPKTRDGWSREASARLFLDLAGDRLTDEAYLEFCLENELHMERVERFLVLGRSVDAARATDGVAHYRLTDAADQILQAGHAKLAVGVVRDRLADPDAGRFRSDFRKWLQARAEADEDIPGARQLAWERLRERPSMETYASLRKIARKAKSWPQDERDVLTLLQKPEHGALLTEVHLAEKRVAEALACLTGLRKPYPRDWGHDQLKRRVAQAAQKQDPEAARDLYLELAEDLIARKTRTYYAQAAPLVKAACAVDDKLARARRQGVMADLRERHRGLPAFWDELRKAGVEVPR
ncbi:MAG: hypothetical protein ACT4PT_12125 [Methanobacteriota archaeon]